MEQSVAGELTEADVQKILKIIDESNFDEIRLEVGDFKIMARKRGAAPAPQAEIPASRSQPTPPPLAVPRPASASVAAAPSPRAPAAAPAEVPPGHVAVRAPMVGTFYQSPSPGAPPFCKEGDPVKATDTVCLIEVMKLFNSIPAGVDGTVARVLVKDAQSVDHNQVLILIRANT